MRKGVKTKEDLQCLLNLTKNLDRRHWDDEMEDYKTELGKLVLSHDRELYRLNTTLGSIGPLYFAFDNKEKTDYSSIYEYVDYLEKAIVTLQNKRFYDVGDLRHKKYVNDIRMYAYTLETIALEHDAYVKNTYEQRDWYNPLRRVNQMETVDAIELLEIHLRKSYTKRQLDKIYNKRISDESYLLTLMQMV